MGSAAALIREGPPFPQGAQAAIFRLARSLPCLHRAALSAAILAKCPLNAGLPRTAGRWQELPLPKNWGAISASFVRCSLFGGKFAPLACRLSQHPGIPLQGDWRMGLCHPAADAHDRARGGATGARQTCPTIRPRPTGHWENWAGSRSSRKRQPGDGTALQGNPWRFLSNTPSSRRAVHPGLASRGPLKYTGSAALA